MSRSAGRSCVVGWLAGVVLTDVRVDTYRAWPEPVGPWARTDDAGVGPGHVVWAWLSRVRVGGATARVNNVINGRGAQEWQRGWTQGAGRISGASTSVAGRQDTGNSTTRKDEWPGGRMAGATGTTSRHRGRPDDGVGEDRDVTMSWTGVTWTKPERVQPGQTGPRCGCHWLAHVGP